MTCYVDLAPVTPTTSTACVSVDTSYWWTINSLGNLAPQVAQPCAVPCVKKQAPKNKEQKETDMRYDYVSTNTEQAQRSYALSRLEEIRQSKNNDLRKQFGLNDDEAPLSLNELLARFNSGKWTFPEDKKDKQYGTYTIFDIIRWRDPAVKEDDAGYKTAGEKLGESYQKGRDAIALGTPTDAKATLDAFSNLRIQ